MGCLSGARPSALRCVAGLRSRGPGRCPWFWSPARREPARPRWSSMFSPSPPPRSCVAGRPHGRVRPMRWWPARCARLSVTRSSRSRLFSRRSCPSSAPCRPSPARRVGPHGRRLRGRARVGGRAARASGRRRPARPRARHAGSGQAGPPPPAGKQSHRHPDRAHRHGTAVLVGSVHPGGRGRRSRRRRRPSPADTRPPRPDPGAALQRADPAVDRPHSSPNRA